VVSLWCLWRAGGWLWCQAQALRRVGRDGAQWQADANNQAIIIRQTGLK